MPSCCAAYGCQNRSNKGFVLKSFPKDPERRAIWAANVRRANWTPTKSSFLCEEHFQPDQWEKTREDGSRKLKWNAIPTIFTYSTANMKRRGSKVLAFEVGKKPKVSCPEDHSSLKGTYSEQIGNCTPCGNNEEASENNGEVSRNVITHISVEEDKMIKTMQTKLDSCYKYIEKQDRQLSRLRETYKLYSKENLKNGPIPALKHIFNADQLTFINNKSMNYHKWSNSTICAALGLKFTCGKRGYESLLNLNLPYPSLRTLRRRLESFKFESGILYEVFDFLKIKIESMSGNDKECVLSFDEISIASSNDTVISDTATSSNFGEVTLPDHTGLATHALVLMIGDISSTWTQTVAYYFTGNSANGETMRNIALDVITMTENLGLRVSSITSSMGPVNKSMWKTFGIDGGKDKVSMIVHPFDASRTIRMAAHPSPFIKKIKVSLLKNKTTQTAAFQFKSNLKLVCVAQFLKSNPNNGKDEGLSQETANVMEGKPIFEVHLPNEWDQNGNIELAVEEVNCLYMIAGYIASQVVKLDQVCKTCVHSIGADTNKNLTFLKFVSLKEISEKGMFYANENTFTFFLEMEILFRKLEKYLIPQKIPDFTKFIHDKIQLEQSINSIIFCECHQIKKSLQNRFIPFRLKIFEFKKDKRTLTSGKFVPQSLATGNSVHQLPPFVSVPRVLTSRKLVPRSFVSRKSIPRVLSRTLVPRASASTELPISADPLNKKKSKPIFELHLPKEWDQNGNTELTNAEQICLYNVVGYIISQVVKLDEVCTRCVHSVASETNNNLTFSKFLSLRGITEKCLYYAHEETFFFFLKMEILFRKLEICLVPHRISDFSKFIEGRIESEQNIKSISFSECHQIKENLKNRFITFRLKIFALKKRKGVNTKI